MSAMLKIVEADADSFAQRAEMFYKKRPELINLVEEFYRTYRALVERYTFLTREIRQNIAPALQAQLGVSSESAQNSPVDLHLKRGLDGPDIISPSYSYTGASEFDYDSPVSEVSAKGHTDDEFSPLGCRTSYERRAFGYKPRYPNVEESSHKASDPGCLHDAGDVDINQLQKELARLQDENKVLANKSAEDVAKLKSLQLDLSSWQSKVRGLEAEDKLTKKRLKSVQEKEQKLEAENLKLSHSLMTSKEEKTELLEQQSKVIEDGKLACQKNQLLEDQMVVLKQNLVTAQSQILEREVDLKRGEEAFQNLQRVLATSEEERLKDSFLMEIFEQQSEDLHKKISELEEKNVGLSEETLAQAAEVKKLQHQLADVMNAKSVASLKLEELQNELEGSQRDRQDLSDQMLQQAGDMGRLKETICKLEEESVRAQIEKMEGAKYVLKLQTDIEEGQRAAETLRASCQQSEDRCKALELEVAQSKEKLLSSSEEISQYQNQLTTFENMVASVDSRNEELQKSVSSLVVEKTSVMNELEKVLEHVKVAEGQCAQMHEIIKEKQEEIERLKQELINQLADTKRLEESFSHVSKEKNALVEREAEISLARQQLENEHIQLKGELELNFTLSEDLKAKISSLEIEKSDLVLESQQMQHKLWDLREENTVLSSQCLNSKAGLEAAEAAVRRAQEDLALSVSGVKKLHEDGCANAELILKLRSDVELSETYLARSREENSLLGEDIEKCTKKLADFEAQINDLKTSLSESVTVNAALAEQVSEKGKNIELLNYELSGAQTKFIAMNEDIASRTSHALGLQEQSNILKEQVKLLRTELQEVSDTKQILETLVEGLQQKDSEAKEANQTLICEQQKLLNEILILQGKNKDFEANLSRLTGEKAALLEEARTHSEQCNHMKQRITSLESDYEALQIQNGSLQDQLVKFEEEKKVMEEENESFSKKLFEAEGRVQDLQLKVSNLLCDEAALAEQLSGRIGNIQILDAALFDLQKDNTTLGEEVGLLQQQVSASRTREASLLSEMHDSSDLIHSLRTEIEKLQQEVLEAEEREKSFTLEQKKSLDECLVMRQKIKDLQKDVGLHAEEKVIFTREIATHTGRRNELNSEVRRLEAEKCSLQQQLSGVQHSENQLQEELRNLLEDRKQLSGVLDFQEKMMEKQEEDLQSLQLELSCAKEEQQSIMDKINLLTEEKAALLQELKDSQHEAGRARDSFLKLETDFSQLQQVKGTTETELGNKIEEVKSLQEDALILQTIKLELEQKLELSSRQVVAQAEEVRQLQDTLALAQQEKATLGSQLVDAERKIMEVSEECDRRKEGCQALTQELAAVFAVKKKLEEELAELQEEQTTNIQKMQHDLICLQEQKEQSALNLEAAILQGHENETKLLYLQEQLNSAESSKLELAEKHSKMSLDWGAAERMLLEEITMLKSASLQQKEDLNLQHNRVIKLEDEIGNLQAERAALQNDKALSVNQMVDFQQQINRCKNDLLEKQEEALKLSLQVSALQQSLLSTERESANLRELLQKDKECHDAAERALKDELCLVQNEVVSKGKQIIELHDTLSGLERKNGVLLEGMSLKENINVELQKEAQLLREEKEELTQKLQTSDAELVQVKANLKLVEAELYELHESLCNLQNKDKSNEACYQAQAQEHTLFKERIEELTGSLSNLQAENTVLKAKLADESSALSIMSHELLILKEEKGETLQKAGLHESQVIALQELLMQAKGECETSKRQADIGAEEVSCLKTEIQNLLSQISDLNRQCRQEHEKFEGSATNLVLLQQELAGAREENIKLSELVSDGARSAKKLQEQVSSLHGSKQDLEGAVNLLKGQLKDSQMMLNNAEKSKEASLHELEGHSQKLLQMMSKIEDLDKMLHINPTSRLASIRHEAIMSQEDFPENSKKQGGDLQEPVSSLDLAKQSLLSEAIHDEVLFAETEPISSPQRSAADNCLQPKSLLFVEPMKIREANASGFEANQKSLFDSSVDAVDRLKEKILILLKEDNSSKDQSVAALVERKSSVEVLLGQLSLLQQEIEHLNSEISLYEKDISHLKRILEGNKLQEEGEVAHAEVKTLQAMLYALHENLIMFKEKSRALQEEVEMAKMEKGSSQLDLSDFQDEGLTYALLLKENLLLSGKGVKLLAGEWDRKTSSNGRHQITECIDKLIKLEKSCTSSDTDGDDNMTQSKGERLKTSLQPEILQPSVANIFLLKQLQKRAEEVILLREAIEDMLPPAHLQDQCKEGQESGLSSSTTEESKPMDKSQESLLSQEQQQWSFSTEHDSEHDIEEIDSIDDQRPEREDEIIERGSLEQAERIDLIEGLARLHINLGMRLHQALMDEKLENELQELKEERKKLEDDLQARVEQVQRMEAELEKLQVILKEGSEEEGTRDPRQQQQWLRHKRRAEKRARKLSKELVLRRQQVGNMRDAVASWAEQQELATELLEEQVLFLVNKEVDPTMEGWDADQVNKLIEEMQNRKALTRRHSMDLQSVGEELQRVGSSIETTQRQLLSKEEQVIQGTSWNAPGITKKQKLSRFGLTWLLLLFSTERKGLFKRSRGSTPLTTTEPPKQITSSRTSAGTTMQSLVAQTRKMGCCACVPSSNQLKSSDDK